MAATCSYHEKSLPRKNEPGSGWDTISPKIFQDRVLPMGEGIPDAYGILFAVIRTFGVEILDLLDRRQVKGTRILTLANASHLVVSGETAVGGGPLTLRYTLENDDAWERYLYLYDGVKPNYR